MARRISKWREFNGIYFQRYNVDPIRSKGEAKRLAKAFRDKGYNARVVETTNGYYLYVNETERAFVSRKIRERTPWSLKKFY